MPVWAVRLVSVGVTIEQPMAPAAECHVVINIIAVSTVCANIGPLLRLLAAQVGTLMLPSLALHTTEAHVHGRVAHGNCHRSGCRSR